MNATVRVITAALQRPETWRDVQAARRVQREIIRDSEPEPDLLPGKSPHGNFVGDDNPIAAWALRRVTKSLQLFNEIRTRH